MFREQPEARVAGREEKGRSHCCTEIDWGQGRSRASVGEAVSDIQGETQEFADRWATRGGRVRGVRDGQGWSGMVQTMLTLLA